MIKIIEPGTRKIANCGKQHKIGKKVRDRNE